MNGPFLSLFERNGPFIAVFGRDLLEDLALFGLLDERLGREEMVAVALRQFTRTGDEAL